MNGAFMAVLQLKSHPIKQSAPWDSNARIRACKNSDGTNWRLREKSVVGIRVNGFDEFGHDRHGSKRDTSWDHIVEEFPLLIVDILQMVLGIRNHTRI